MATKDALILLNMGGANNLQEVEVFLRNMFNDKNILTIKSDLLRKIIGSMIIANRLKSAQDIYRKLDGKSPIVGHTKRLVKKLQSRLGQDVVVDFVMRYTPPFATEVLERLNKQKIDKIYLIPLYPQYSTTTTKSSLEDFQQCCHIINSDALLIETKHFFESKIYNKMLIEIIKSTIKKDKYEDFDIIFSAHGLPQKIVDTGDVYEKHINRHVELLKSMMKEQKMNFHNIYLAYQSKVGHMKWLEPSLDSVLKSIKNKNVIILPIAFTIDNSETDYELNIEYKGIAKSIGIEDYRVCSCPNDHDMFVDTIYDIYNRMKY